MYTLSSVNELCSLNISLQCAVLRNLNIDLIADFCRINKFGILEVFPKIGLGYFTLQINKER